MGMHGDNQTHVYMIWVCLKMGNTMFFAMFNKFLGVMMITVATGFGAGRCFQQVLIT